MDKAGLSCKIGLFPGVLTGLESVRTAPQARAVICAAGTITFVIFKCAFWQESRGGRVWPVPMVSPCRIFLL